MTRAVAEAREALARVTNATYPGTFAQRVEDLCRAILRESESQPPAAVAEGKAPVDRSPPNPLPQTLPVGTRYADGKRWRTIPTEASREFPLYTWRENGELWEAHHRDIDWSHWRKTLDAGSAVATRQEVDTGQGGAQPEKAAEPVHPEPAAGEASNPVGPLPDMLPAGTRFRYWGGELFEFVTPAFLHNKRWYGLVDLLSGKRRIRQVGADVDAEGVRFEKSPLSESAGAKCEEAEKCARCDGRGACGAVGMEVQCGICHGTGEEPHGELCRRCAGIGELSAGHYERGKTNPCPDCNGTGRSPELTPVDEAATKR